MECDEATGKVYNIGTNEEVTIEQLADKVIAAVGSGSGKKFVPYEVAYGRPIEDMMRRKPCIDKIGEAIGWKPKTNLSQTIDIITESFKEK